MSALRSTGGSQLGDRDSPEYLPPVENSSFRSAGAAFHHGQIFTGKGAAEKAAPFEFSELTT
jgi:hypothetical protein